MTELTQLYLKWSRGMVEREGRKNVGHASCTARTSEAQGAVYEDVQIQVCIHSLMIVAEDREHPRTHMTEITPTTQEIPRALS